MGIFLIVVKILLELESVYKLLKLRYGPCKNLILLHIKDQLKYYIYC